MSNMDVSGSFELPVLDTCMQKKILYLSSCGKYSTYVAEIHLVNARSPQHRTTLAALVNSKTNSNPASNPEKALVHRGGSIYDDSMAWRSTTWVGHNIELWE